MTPEERKEMLCMLAERVMGWRIYTSGRNSTVAMANANTMEESERILFSTHPWESPEWAPDTSITDAWLLVDALKAKGMYPEIGCRTSGEYYAMVFLDDEFWSDTQFHSAPTAPLAICLAAYEVVRGWKPQTADKPQAR